MALGCCVALGLGSDSARVNEVAKLCRAVVHRTKDEWSSEGSARGFPTVWEAEDWTRRYKSCGCPSLVNKQTHGVGVYHCVRWVRSSV